MEEKLKDILKDITNWLNFAEAKNLAIITFNSVWLSFFYKQFFDSKLQITVVNIILIIILVLSMLINLFSFIPKLFTKLTLEDVLKLTLKDKSSNDNLMFYKDILKYSPGEYYNAIQERSFISIGRDVKDTFETDQYRYEKTLVTQIVALSGIAYKKYWLFNLSLFFTIVSVILGAVTLIML